MKTFLLALACCLATLTAQSTPILTDDTVGIRFFKGSWNDVLAEAKRQNKPVFVDVYTTWCGPCKLMAREAFPNPQVSEKFNASFINYQIDAEKGEGVTIAKQYAVDAYPTSLFVLGDGNLIYKTSGYTGIQGMMAEADKAIEEAKDPKPLTAWEQEYKSGKRDADFLYGYLKKMASLERQDETVVAEYIKSIPDAERLSEKNIGWYSRTITSVKSADFEKLVQEIARLSQAPATAQQGADVFSGLQQIIGKSWQQAVSTKNEQLCNR
ncbi:thioredoxin domain protein [Fibrisoma limi BUZ 3]|uniref:Thioredoxin domain protein n=1 Tax=Fibrisoma limi BUZ 3 TaxID=1185876 RepID=I2GB91_9BACT|nr:DUF255 domain-containing protein [Fibrisoma limi]CCH51165.1 thioredoxin domain protein [Fibrisoma limi BUZ 3]